MNFCDIAAATILFFGDSLCWVSGSPVTSAIPARVNAACAATVASDCDPGRGTRTPGWSGLDPRVVFTSRLASDNPDVCVLMLGTNSFAAGDSHETAIADLADYITECRDSGASPVLATGFPINDGFTANRGFWLGVLHERVMALGQAMGVPVADLAAPYNARTFRTDCTWNGTSYDGVHPWADACLATAAEAVVDAIP